MSQSPSDDDVPTTSNRASRRRINQDDDDDGDDDDVSMKADTPTSSPGPNRPSPTAKPAVNADLSDDDDLADLDEGGLFGSGSEDNAASEGENR